MSKRFKVEVRIKREVHDPQGQALEHVLNDLGFKGVTAVRVGKLVEFDIENVSRDVIEKMSREVFSNPVIEDFQVHEV